MLIIHRSGETQLRADKVSPVEKIGVLLIGKEGRSMQLAITLNNGQ